MLGEIRRGQFKYEKKEKKRKSRSQDSILLTKCVRSADREDGKRNTLERLHE